MATVVAKVVEVRAVAAWVETKEMAAAMGELLAMVLVQTLVDRVGAEGLAKAEAMAAASEEEA